MRNTALCFVAFVTAFLFALPTASAESWEDDGSYSKDDWPLQVTKRPLVLAPGMLELAGNTVRVSLSKDFVGDPISLAPSLFYGINKKLSVGITHDTGICVAGDLCDKTYNDLALGARYFDASPAAGAVGAPTSVTIGHPTVGFVLDGGQLIKEIPTSRVENGTIALHLKHPNNRTATNINS